MNCSTTISTSLTSEKAKKILEEKGMHVTVEQAGAILAVLIKFAQITLQTIAHENSLSIHPGKHR